MESSLKEANQYQCQFEAFNDHNELWSGHETEAICCVCGCEDNEDLEIMIHPCSCGGGLASAHPKCVLSALESVAVKKRNKQEGSSTLCPLCGGKGFLLWGNGIPSSHSSKDILSQKPRRSLRRPNSEQLLKGSKRLRSSLAPQSEIGKKMESPDDNLSRREKYEAEGCPTFHTGRKKDCESAETMKPEATVLGRRFADAAVTVPIKKRRIQLMEDLQPPSSPLKSPASPQPDAVAARANKVVGDLDDGMQSLQDTGLVESGTVEHMEVATLKRLEAEYETFQADLLSGRKQVTHPRDEKESSVSRIIDIAVSVDQQKNSKVETVEIGECGDMIERTGVSEKVEFLNIVEQKSSLSDPRFSSAASEIMVFQNTLKDGEACAPIRMTNMERDSQCQTSENNKDVKVHCEIQKVVSKYPGDSADKVQEQFDETHVCSEVSFMRKDEERPSSEQRLDESRSATMAFQFRDDRSHWDLNMEMEAWERPLPETCNADTFLAIPGSFSRTVSDSPEEGEVVMSPEKQELTEGGVMEDTRADQKDVVGPLDRVFNTLPSSRTTFDSNALLHLGSVIMTARPVLSSDAAAAAADDIKDAKGNTCSEFNVNPKVAVPDHVSFPVDSGVNVSEVVSQTVPLTGNLASTLTPEGTVDSNTTMSVLVDARRPTSSPETVDSGLEINTRDQNEDIRERILRTDAFEEEEYDVDSLRTSQDAFDRDNEGDGTMRSCDWDEGVGEELEAEDVDYGDSENENDQAHGDGDTYDVEADDLASVGSQEREFEDNQTEDQKEAEGDTGDERPTDQCLDLAGEVTHVADIGISHNRTDEQVEVSSFNKNEDESAVKDSLSCHKVAAEDGKIGGEKAKFYSKNPSEASSLSEKIGNAVRVRSSGWDQLPEGFEKAEDALRAAKEGSLRGGRGGSRGTFVSFSGRGSSIRMDTSLGKRLNISSSDQSRSDQRYGDWIDENASDRRVSSRDFAMARTRGRGRPSSMMRGSRVDAWDNGPAGHPGPWAPPKRYPSPPGRFGESIGLRAQRNPPVNAAAAAAAKLESSGFIVAPDGTIIKAENAGKTLRGGAVHSFPRGGRSGSNGKMFNSGGRGPMGMGVMNPRTKLGMSSGRGFEYGPDMRGGSSLGFEPGERVGGRGMVQHHRFPPHKAVESFSSRPSIEHSEKWTRRERRLSPLFWDLRRSSPSSHAHNKSRSRSRTRSPRLQMPSRTGTNLLDTVLRRSHSPPYVRSVVRGKSQESTPSGQRLIHSPRLPLPPLLPRGQRSPQTGLRRLLVRRDVDRKYDDLEPAKSNAERHTSPKRLSSTIVPVTTSDEPDQQHIVARRNSGSPFGGRLTHADRKDDLLLLHRQRRKDEQQRVGETDEGFYIRPLEGREDSEREIFKPRRDGRMSGNKARHAGSGELDDEVAPRRRRSPQ